MSFDDTNAAPLPPGIAIVGMAGRFPGAASVRELWRMACEGRHGFSRFAPEEIEDVYTELERAQADYVPVRPILPDADLFDAALFGMKSREAALTDPQHRAFLEVSWAALEDAGYDPRGCAGASIGVYAGCSYNTYMLHHVLSDPAVAARFTTDFQVGSYDQLVGGIADAFATRVAYKLDLRGPAMTIATACSTSLTAVAQAVQALSLHECDMALAGGVSVTFPQQRGYIATEGAMVSPDGTCRPFDAGANGTVFGSGAAVVLLKRVEDAVRDGDHIYAVIRGTAVNNDGASKVGFTAPSVDAQAEVIATAQAVAGVEPGDIGYVECHGTATPLGDPIEVAALKKAFGPVDGVRCLIGSVKGNVGHLDAAAGVTGLIKAALAVESGTIPPTLHFQRPNPLLEIENSPFAVAGSLSSWPEKPGPRRAGVSALGVGGTNVHVVLEQAPETGLGATSGETVPHLLALSSRTAEGLAEARKALAARLAAEPDLDLAGVAHTLRTGRTPFAHRTAVVARDSESAIAALNASAAVSGEAKQTSPLVVFMFPGQGSQHLGMGSSMYRDFPVFRAEMDRCADLLRPQLGADIREILWPAEHTPEALARLTDTAHAQPAIFAVEYALARQWQALGVQPSAMVGHSVGEFVVACLSGVFSLEDALSLVAERGRLMSSLPGGAMLSVRLPEKDLVPLLPQGVSIAAINGPSLCVAAGPFEAIERLEAMLKEKDVLARRLHTSHAFHSAMLDPILPALTEKVRGMRLSPPASPYVSTLTGTRIRPDEATSPDYWARHCRDTVRFEDALRTIADAGSVLLEVGPGVVLTTLATQSLGRGRTLPIVAALSDPAAERPDADAFVEAAGRLWCTGVEVDRAALPGADGPHRRVSLPPTVLDRRRYWVDRKVPAAAAAAPALPAPEPAPAAPPVSELPAVVESALNDRPVIAAAAPLPSRDQQLADVLRAILEDLSGEDLSGADPATSFLELGFDSLFLTQAVRRINDRFGVKLGFRQLLGELSSISALVGHLLPGVTDAMLPPPPATVAPAVPAAPAIAAPMPITAAPVAPATPAHALAAPAGSIEGLLRAQLETMSALMARQLDALQGSTALASPAAIPAAVQAPVATPAPAPATPVPAPASVGPAAKPASDNPGGENNRFAGLSAARAAGDLGLTDAQKAHIADLVAAYNAKTKSSKALTEKNRAVLADPRVVAGFRPEWKELIYPIVTDRSSGSKLWDIDGNEYVDILNGFGPTALGHAPDFVVEAMQEQLKKGFEIGPMTPLAGEVADLVCELTGNERATLCNTGSEAVMAAMRIARTVTGRDKVVMFTGSYHGQFDEVLIKKGRRNGQECAVPSAPGIPLGSAGNMVVLDYAAPASLDWIRAHAGELAAVLVEPVQSRHPDLQPVEFIRDLRKVADEAGFALVFDEVVTGFRMHPGGMQAVFGIRADLATYGKVAGGGMPIGILAGKKRFMDALDGGEWRFGDDSAPEVGVTFVAGTFVRHPVTLAACKAVLEYLKAQGPELQQRVAGRTRTLVDALNHILSQRGIRSRVETYGSVFYVNFANEDRLASLFYHHMRLRGVHLQEGFPCFLTTSHSDEDFAQIERAFRESIDALQSVGIVAGNAQAASAAPAVAPAPAAPAPSATARQAEPIEIPLTEPQTEIWMAAQLGDEASCAFNESVSITLRGPLDTGHVQAALDRIVERHEALRLVFEPNGERATIQPHAPSFLPVLDLSVLPADEAQERFDALIASEAKTPFELSAGRPWRATLVKRAAQEHVLVFTAHHIVCDGWSSNVIVTELAEIVDALASGREPDLGPAVRWADHVDAEAKLPSDPAWQETKRYWLAEYETLPPTLDLPTDRPAPATRSFRGATTVKSIGVDTLARVKALGKARSCTPFATLLTGFEILVGRLAQLDDIVVAIPFAGQVLEEDGSLVGHCVNFLPVRARWTPETRAEELLAATQTKLFEASENQRFTLGTLVRERNVPRDMSRLPLTSVQFNFERTAEGLKAGEATVDLKANPKAAANYDVFFNVVERQGRLDVECDYATDVLDEVTIHRWIGHYQTILEELAADPSRSVARLPLLTEAERQLMLSDWNATEGDYRRDIPMHRMFEERAASEPDRTALVFGEERLTYGDLDRQAEALAQRIRAKVPGTGERVAVLLERSPRMVAALIAVLKAGHAYVPLDPRFPPARIAATLKAARVAAVITEDASKPADLPEAAALINLDQSRPELVAGGKPAQAPKPTDPAYVIFTSGSTGVPKGVAVGHQSVVNFLTAMAAKPGLSADDTMLSVTTISFDIAVLEIFGPLSVGGTVVIASREDVVDGSVLLDMIHAKKATVMQATPSGWRMVLEAGLKGRTPPGFRIFCGGEALPADLAIDLRATGAAVWNLYGPTETTIWSSAGLVGEGPVTIGEPILNTSFFIVDRHDELLPPGAPGELLIGGEGLALGYFDNPDLTAKAFPTLAIGGLPPRRLYRTGDLARRLPNGSIQHLGRKDHQVKLRGFRIELEEIETVMRSFPGVAEAAASVVTDDAGAQRLCGYFTGDPVVTKEALQAHVAAQLPDYMRPVLWKRLDAMPLTGNGKLDRKALPQVALERAVPARPGSAAEAENLTPVQQKIQAVWKEVLKLDHVPVEESIYALGADSIQVSRIAARLTAEGLPITARHILKDRTVAKLASSLEIISAPASSAPSLSDFRRSRTNAAQRTTLQ
jgi:amino acid adenylation domain-containing protein